ncbi:MAG TPA: agmatinase [Candidatus Methanofastidiosa archaeon]|nr:agmatinase [Candidatus Methanofastidiosa archaeon]HPR42244.1 agmatinase [Candidatus Methanofastidiosa archaeon]
MSEDLYFYTYRKCFFPLDRSTLDDSDFLLVGVPFDSTQTGNTGSRYGPSSIRLASFELELYDLETDVDISDIALHDIGDIDCVPGSAEDTFDRIKYTYGRIPKGKTVITLGGEHSITYPIVNSLKVDSVVSFDAHPDLREDYMGLRLSHSSVMRRVFEDGKNVDIVGVREGSRGEAEYALENNIPLIQPMGLDSYSPPEGKDVYISIDLDVFENVDVGNPVPGGMGFDDMLKLSRDIIRNNRVAGFDIVELCSQPNEPSSYLAAKLLYKMVSYIEKYQRKYTI